MRAHIIHPRSISQPFILAAILVAPVFGLQSARAVVLDPLANGPVDPDLFVDAPVPNPIGNTAPAPQQRPRQNVRPANYQTDANPPVAGRETQNLPAPAGAPAVPKEPCAAVPSKPLNQLGIGIAAPTGRLPDNLATTCWTEINGQGGTAAARCWPIACYNWEATCFYHNPLYFEEANAERYGYQCGDRSCCFTCGRECCLQPAASAAHFYGSVLALPYCMAAECPGDCVYTLGHYRPGNCNPWRWYWPTCDPLAAAASGGIWTGLIFAIP